MALAQPPSLCEPARTIGYSPDEQLAMLSSLAKQLLAQADMAGTPSAGAAARRARELAAWVHDEIATFGAQG
jgi:hypothetical protein